NFVPARLTAILMAAVSFNFRTIKFIFKYGQKHSSPNAGYPEAALAGILNCCFGGPNRYNGKLVEKPFIGENPRPVSAKDVYKACFINMAVTLVFISGFVLWLV
ncbi:MAG TPA: cobalamin biosynthesis protein, partial [Draconibacterium sp.]|nr:cobalamin biosynthesis protein [Draconibacterium sp.]